MAIGKTNAGAGGSGGVNFRVVGGLTQPTSPKENTIWVPTDIDIPYWTTAASSKTPAYVAEKGVVTFWWESATDTEVSGATDAGFTPVKYKATNPPGYMRLKPINCYQNQDGTAAGWKSMDAYIYKGGEWVQFSDEIDYIFKSGVGSYSDILFKKGPSAKVTIDNETIQYYCPGTEYCDGFIYFKDKFDLSDCNVLCFDLESTLESGTLKVGVAATIADNYYSQSLDAYISVSAGERRTVTVDVSNISGKKYIVIVVGDSSSNSTKKMIVHNIYLG